MLRGGAYQPAAVPGISSRVCRLTVLLRIIEGLGCLICS